MQESLDTRVAELLRGFPIVVTTLVAWGDMDANRHVNNVVYFRYMEHARLHYFGELGFSKLQLETGIGPILSWTDCRFRRPLAYPDNVSIGTRISSIEDHGFLMDSIIVSHALADIAAKGQQRLVVYDYRQHKKVSLPAAFRQRIAEIEAQAGNSIAQTPI